MTKEQLASQLNGREYREEITKAEEQAAKFAGLLVIFGYSDDNVELRGAAYDEVSAFDGEKLSLHREEPILLPQHEDCDCNFCGYEKVAERCAEVKAVWDGGNGYSWVFETAIPHETFDIMEDGDKFCRGIVIAVADLPSIA